MYQLFLSNMEILNKEKVENLDKRKAIKKTEL